jgi:sugar diacid utilization regulator
MAFCCADLLELKSFREIRLIAGEMGLYRKVTWPFTCYTPNVTQWLYGGELLFSASKEANETSLLLLMQECIEKGLAGMVILKGGKYIPAIPPSLIELANRSSFPLFEMPWNLKMIDIIKEIAELIVMHCEQSKKHALFLEQLLFSKSQNQSFEDLSMNANITPKPFRFIALVGIQDSQCTNMDEIKSDIALTLKFHTPEKSCEIVCMGHNNTIICLALADSENHVHQLEASITKAFNVLENRYPHAGLRLGFGSICQQGASIQQSYDEAKKVLTMMKKNLQLSNVLHYSNLGIFRLFFEIQNPEKIQSYYMENIGDLIVADQKNHTELLKTLRCYLYNNCNLRKTAQTLFIHRNTLFYRLNLIRDTIGKNLDDPLVRHELFISIIAAEFLGARNVCSNSSDIEQHSDCDSLNKTT